MRFWKEEDNLFDNKEKMQRVEGFFKDQVQVFDAAVKMEEDLKNDLNYLRKEGKQTKHWTRSVWLLWCKATRRVFTAESRNWMADG